MNRLINFFLTGLFFIPAAFSFAQKKNIESPEKYSQVRIFSVSESDNKSITDAGLHIDHAERKSGYTQTWLSESEIEMLKNSGVSYKIMIRDWAKYYRSLPKMTDSEIRDQLNESSIQYGVSHSIYGSLNGNLALSEVVAKLDSMRLEYPELISQKFSIGQTIEGRQIWTVRVTRNPNLPTGRPEVWFNSLTHAREPDSMQQLIFFMYWLFENYNIDPVATYILNNRELYFTPVINPDGYEYNRSQFPAGGGLWRKNRRINSDGSIGVDLNRNFGTFQYWNSPNNGSSTIMSSDTYRGTSPFSEPETRAIMNFVNTRNFQVILDAHTYNNSLIKPWSWQDPIPTPDDHKFNEYLKDMSKYNKFHTGAPSQTVGYKLRGAAGDWFYNDSAHGSHKIISICPEVSNHFWAPKEKILPIAEKMLYTNQYAALIGGGYVFPVSSDFNKQTYTPGESGILKAVFKNKGTAAARNIKIECTSQSQYLNIPITFFNYPNLYSFTGDSSSFGFTLSSVTPNNSAIPVDIKFTQDDSVIMHKETKYVLNGNGIITLVDSAENGLNNWSTNSSWGITNSQAHSSTNSFTDSPLGNYGVNTKNSMTLTLPLDFSTSPITCLSFWHKYATEAVYDFCYVEVSSDNGTSWQQVTSYNGTLSIWTRQFLDITSFANSSAQVKIRFTLQSDAMVSVEDGWYIDDISIVNYNPLINTVVTNLNLTLANEGFYNPVMNSLSLKDTVSVYLRNIFPPYAKVDSARGVIDSLTFGASFGFRNVSSGSYYITVNHRNSVETWSKAGGEVFTTGGTKDYNFTTSASQSYGNNLQLVGTKFCIYTGDVDQDGSVDLDDLLLTHNDAANFSTGYLNTDVSGDYVVELSDILMVYNNSAEFVTKKYPQ